MSEMLGLALSRMSVYRKTEGGFEDALEVDEVR